MSNKKDDNSEMRRDDLYHIIFKNYPDVLNVRQVSEILDLSTKTVYKLIRGKQLSCLKVGREFRIPKVSLMSFLKILPPPDSTG